MAFVVFCNQQYVAFVFFRYQHNGFCFVPASTTLLLFCSGINKVAFVFFQHKQHGFCLVPMSTISSRNNTVEIILGTPFSFYTYSGSWLRIEVRVFSPRKKIRLIISGIYVHFLGTDFFVKICRASLWWYNLSHFWCHWSFHRSFELFSGEPLKLTSPKSEEGDFWLSKLGK